MLRKRHRVSEAWRRAQLVTLDEARVGRAGQPAHVLALDDALDALAAIDPREGQVVEMRGPVRGTRYRRRRVSVGSGIA